MQQFIDPFQEAQPQNIPPTNAPREKQLITLENGERGFFVPGKFDVKSNDASQTPRQLFVKVDDSGKEVGASYYDPKGSFTDVTKGNSVEGFLKDPDTFDEKNPSNFDPNTFNTLQKFKGNPEGLRQYLSQNPELKIYKQTTQPKEQSPSFIDPFVEQKDTAKLEQEKQAHESTEGPIKTLSGRALISTKGLKELGALPDGVIEGLADQGIGLNQLLLAGLTKIGLVPEETYSNVMKQFKGVLKSDPLLTSKENFEESDVGRTVGNVGSYILPGAAIAKAPSAIKATTEAVARGLPSKATEALAKFGAKSGTNYAEAGAIGANLQYVPEEESRGVKTVVGAVLGATGGKAAEKIIGGIAARQALKNEGNAARASAGAAPENMPGGTGNSTQGAEQASNAADDAAGIFKKPDFINDGKTPNSQIPFVDDADSLGVRVTKGDASQDFGQQEFESRAAKMQDIGDQLRAFRGGQQEDIIKAGGNIATKVGGTQDKVAAGAELQQTLRKTAQSEKAAISESYELAKAAKGNDAILSADELKPKITEIIDDFEDVIPAPIINKLNNYGIGKETAEAIEGQAQKEIPALTVAEAEKLIKSINLRRSAASDGATKLGLDRIKGAIDESLDSLAQGSDEAVNLFKQGRAQRTEYGNTFEQSDIVESIIAKKAKFTNQINPQKVVEKIVYDRASNLENIPKIKSALTKSGADGVKSWNGIRGATIDDIINQSVQGADTGGPFFNVGRFNRQMEKVGDDALKMIFTPDEFADIKKFQRVVTQIQRKAPGAVNNSNTATSLINMINTSPVLSGYFGGILKSVGRRVQKYKDIGQVSEAVHGARRPTASAVEKANEKLKPVTSPIIRLLSAGIGRTAADSDVDESNK